MKGQANQNQRNTQRGQNRPRKKKYIPLISVLIPALNEEESIDELSKKLEAVLEKMKGFRYEVLFIDDGSTDSTFSVMRRINQRNNRFKALRFRRNYGKSAALSVGFNRVKGDYVVTMDADLQDDPDEIPNLINKLMEGFDLVSGWKKKRRDPISKTIPSKIFNYFTSLVSGVHLHDHNCGLKGYKKSVVKNLEVYGEMHRYLPALANWEGFSVTEIPVKHHARKYGKTKFGMGRFIKGFLDLLTVIFTTRFVKRPLHFFGTLGTLFVLAGVIIDGYLTVEWLLGETYLSDRPLIFLGVGMIIVGVQFISMGLIGELIAKNFYKNVRYGIKERI